MGINQPKGDYIIQHDEKGMFCPLHEQTLYIPERNVKITVWTNLHYGSKSYMNAAITMMDRNVLNFFDTSLLSSIKKVKAKPGDWNMLFDDIVRLYNNIYNSEKSINTYFDIIEEAVVGKNTKAGTELHYAVVRLSEITCELSNSIYCDSEVIKFRIKKACHLLIKRLMSLKISSNCKPWTKELNGIFRYLSEREMIVDVLFWTN